MKRAWDLVETAPQLAKAKKAIRAASIIALDTEYDSFRYFHEKLCLIQVQTGGKTWLIDPLAGLDLSFLGEAMADPAILKVLHAGDNDIRILKRDCGFAFNNIFDTHRAALLLGFRLLSLATLLEHYLGVRLEKKLQRSRWDLRPLSGGQLDYASLDTVHLTDLYRKLDAGLREKGLEKEAARLFAEICAVAWQPKTLDGQAHRKMKGYQTLTARQKERLRSLFRWRFEKSREINRAPFMLLPDQHLLGLARIENAAPGALTAPGLLTPEKATRFGAELLGIIRDRGRFGEV
ncbi:MAG: ribonuclease D [Proteobacteria bacterium]|nr:ribonuclease D [Pseudomonadota bacterium]MBU2262719.1 ribonuclease D [Pseudomonadota bacterium]